MGLVFADPEKVQREVKTTSAVQPRLKIPPRDNNYSVSALLPETLPDCELLGMAPHMHLRGKSFRYTLISADKSKQVLLDIPRYDFNWQTAYRLTEPLKIAAGSKILCDAVFDNSDNNLNNPDPNAWVHWGDQTTDEMMIGYFDVLVPKDSHTGDQSSRTQYPDPSRIARRVSQTLDGNSDGKLDRSEVPQRWQNQFNLLDQNQDNTITADELKESD